MQELFSILPEAESTNNYAMGAIRKGLAQDGSCWFTDTQTQGKGQRGKSWTSPAGQTIAMSICLKHEGATTNLFQLNAAVAVVVRNILADLSGKKTFSIKWPNDIYFGDKKAAGILIENIYRGKELHWSVVGIGINVLQQHFGAGLERAISLKQIIDKNWLPEKLARAMHTACNELLKDDQFLNNALRVYNASLYKKNEIQQFAFNGQTKFLQIAGVNEAGQCCTDDGNCYNWGELEWVW